MNTNIKSKQPLHLLSIAAAVSILTSCGGGSGDNPDYDGMNQDGKHSGANYYKPSEDRLGPTIVIYGDNPLIIKKGASLIDEGAIALDNFDGKTMIEVDPHVNTNKAGYQYIEYSSTDESGNTTKVKRKVIVRDKVTIEKHDREIGPQKVNSTALSKGTIFVSTNGSGSRCSDASPCSYTTALSRAKAGDVVFFKEGTYYATMGSTRGRIYLKGGTSSKPITYESYPGQTAILDGSRLPIGTKPSGIILKENYVNLRKLEVVNMPDNGIRIESNGNIIDGVKVHHNKMTGIHIISGEETDNDRKGSYNTIKNCTIHHNSDAGLHGYDMYDYGDNADGISISSGAHNKITHNLIYSNSDDGIDTWKSIYTEVDYNIVHSQGLGRKGNGNGIKLGGVSPKNRITKNDYKIGLGSTAKHNIVYNNKQGGMDCNSGKVLLMEYNTAYKNGQYGFRGCKAESFDPRYKTTLKNNISVSNKNNWVAGALNINNSWNMGGSVNFISTNPDSEDFLRPTSGSKFSNIGAYGKI